MKILNIGGATAIIEHNDKKFLFDPWMDEGIFHGSWFHYPPNQVELSVLKDIDYVYISHIHEDHCSALTIREINPDAEIIIMDHGPNFVAKFLDAHQFKFKKIHLIPPRDKVKINDEFFVELLEGDPNNAMSFAIDSSLIIDWDDFIILNANDNQPHPEAIEYINHQYPKINLGLLPYGGGSGYPACYQNLSHEEKNQEKKALIQNRIKIFHQTVSELNPLIVMPFADQYVVGGKRAKLNTYLAHPVSPGVVKEDFREDACSQLLLLNSGQTFDFELSNYVPDEPYQMFGESDRQAYINSHLKQCVYDFEKITVNPAVAIDRLVKHARDRLWQQQNREDYFPTYRIYLEIEETTRLFSIDFKSTEVIEVFSKEKLITPYLKMTCPASLMMMLLIGQISWNIADAALFIDYVRQPNDYDTQIYKMINFLKV
jgi:UDP-MurNAc hydroxylase